MNRSPCVISSYSYLRFERRSTVGQQIYFCRLPHIWDMSDGPFCVRLQNINPLTLNSKVMYGEGLFFELNMCKSTVCGDSLCSLLAVLVDDGADGLIRPLVDVQPGIYEELQLKISQRRNGLKAESEWTSGLPQTLFCGICVKKSPLF